MLSSKYPPTLYSSSWSCYKNFNIKQETTVFHRSNSVAGNLSSVTIESNVSSTNDLLNLSLHLLMDSLMYDLNFQANLLKFCGNLLSGNIKLVLIACSFLIEFNAQFVMD